jgi:hypothetical protein
MRVAMTSHSPETGRARQFWALICLLLFAALQLLATSEPLHKALHSDAGTPAHHCAVTLLTHGQVSAPAAAVALAVFVATLLFSLPLLKSAAFSSSDYRLSPSRAPPSHSR